MPQPKPKKRKRGPPVSSGLRQAIDRTLAELLRPREIDVGEKLPPVRVKPGTPVNPLLEFLGSLYSARYGFGARNKIPIRFGPLRPGTIGQFRPFSDITLDPLKLNEPLGLRRAGSTGQEARPALLHEIAHARGLPDFEELSNTGSVIRLGGTRSLPAPVQFEEEGRISSPATAYDVGALARYLMRDVILPNITKSVAEGVAEQSR